ncbi:MAG: cytochrome b5 domain-containing protein [Candidatus Micrarchaeia archaeon]|jgi:cytochrome b involved in lipid metabolism
MKNVFLALVPLFLLFAGCAGSGQPAEGGQAGNASQGQPSTSPAQNSSQSQALLTLAAVAAHNSQSDCWLAIGGFVYDITSFSSHPGGTAYVPFCGTDATVAFATKGGTGNTHSANALAMLPRYRIGALGSAGLGPAQPGQNSSQNPPAAPPLEPGQPVAAIPPAQNQTILTLGEVAKHSTQSDCWLAISGAVYDLTSFSNHPGGTAYVPFCGTDATNAFATKGGRGSPHSANAVAMLPNFRIGLLGAAATPLPPSAGQANRTGGYGGDDGEYENEGEGWEDE